MAAQRAARRGRLLAGLRSDRPGSSHGIGRARNAGGEGRQALLGRRSGRSPDELGAHGRVRLRHRRAPDRRARQERAPSGLAPRTASSTARRVRHLRRDLRGARSGTRCEAPARRSSSGLQRRRVRPAAALVVAATLGDQRLVRRRSRRGGAALPALWREGPLRRQPASLISGLRESATTQTVFLSMGELAALLDALKGDLSVSFAQFDWSEDWT